MIAAAGTAAPGSANAPADREEIAGRLFVSIARLSRRLRQIDPTVLGPGAISALGMIVAYGPMRLGDLATTEGVRAPTMSRIVDALVAEGNAERIPDPADGRACLVRATDSGGALIAGAKTARARHLIERMAHLDEAQLAAIADALPALELLCSDDYDRAPVSATEGAE
ncbi:MAG TPA: MarR family transcriptional regulator [Micromonosporaceae bacterium]